MTKVGRKAENADVQHYTFGPFRLDTRAGELRRGEHRVALTPKVFELLLLLVQNPGRLIAKQELLDHVWRGTNVEEGSVTRAVAKLRAALDDSTTEPQFIETVARRGYRFICGVQDSAFDEVTRRSDFELVENGRRHRLKDGENVIGRAADCEVTMELASISRRHAVITVHEGKLTLRDLQSKNGTFVQGRRIEATVDVAPDDRIRVGSIPVVIVATASDPSTFTETAQTARRKHKP